MLSLKDFRQLLSSDAGQVVTRQFFFVTFSSSNVVDLEFPSDLGLYVQNFDLPNLTLDDDGAVVIKNPRGTFKVPGDSLIIPESNAFTIDFLETEVPIIENIFIPWLEKVVNVRESNSYPFPKANVRVDIFSTENVKDIIFSYIFYGVYPTQITLPTLGQAAQTDISRPITFAFDKTKVVYTKHGGNNKDDSTVDTPKKQKEKEIQKAMEKIPKNKNIKSPKDIKVKKSSFDFQKTFDESIKLAQDIKKIIKKPLDINNIKIAKKIKNPTVDKAVDNMLQHAKNANKVKKVIKS
jgi:hypothetical protein